MEGDALIFSLEKHVGGGGGHKFIVRGGYALNDVLRVFGGIVIRVNMPL